MIAGLCRPPPQTSHSRGGAGKWRQRGGDRGGGHLGKRRGAVGEPRDRPAWRRGNRRGRAISAAAREKRMLQKTRDMRFRSLPGAAPGRRRNRPSAPVWRRTQSSISALPGSGVEGEDLVAGPSADPGHVADPAEVEHRDRLSPERRRARRGRAAPAAPPARRRRHRRCGNRRRHRSRSAAPAMRRRRSARCGAPPGGAGSCGRESRSGRSRSAGCCSRNRATASACSRVSSASTAHLHRDRRRRARRAACRGTRPDTATVSPVRQRPRRSPSVASGRDIDAVERGAAHQPQRMTQICAR